MLIEMALVCGVARQRMVSLAVAFESAELMVGQGWDATVQFDEPVPPAAT
jgi:hypothetical protein